MKNFLYEGSWFEKLHNVPGNSRYWTFKIALNLYAQMGGKIIVETGTTTVGDLGAGASTVIFGEYLIRYDGVLYTVDIEPEYIKKCKEVTKPYATKIHYEVSDSLLFLKGFKDKIDLLYLDSYDYPLDGSSPLPCQEHQLDEVKLAYPKMNGGIVLLDDNMIGAFPGSKGKTKLSKEYLLVHGATLIMDYQQSLWIL